MAEREILIREACEDDLKGIYRLYADYMFDSSLLRFGRAFVEEYLKVIVRSKGCVTLIAKKGHAVGFIMVAFNSRKLFLRIFFNRRIIYRWLKQGLTNPKMALGGLESLYYPARTYLERVKAEFLFIAIEPEYRRIGLAARLINEVLSQMSKKEIEKVKVTTLADNNSVNKLLHKLGFKVEKEFKFFKKLMYLHSYEL